MMPAEQTRADLQALWAAIFRLYRGRPAVGTLGAEVVGLALEAEDLITLDPSRARASIERARFLLEDLGEPAASRSRQAQ
ncbi:hypothetical protein GBA63_22630 (plasmid) [Rubrobacter tropicus]|uniref:Uncharacterized protein n=1 Tax=Rubrobacter tropicus TaxID=2653851 RepID=A0A6G8QG48_9ACTN|nr:hypothetical protein [Rubrobacter tropicus]QIN85496.1 hypothetical protein GBA63_22630 [Rubrobacter tropicus]